GGEFFCASRTPCRECDTKDKPRGLRWRAPDGRGCNRIGRNGGEPHSRAPPRSEGRRDLSPPPQRRSKDKHPEPGQETWRDGRSAPPSKRDLCGRSAATKKRRAKSGQRARWATRNGGRHSASRRRR